MLTILNDPAGITGTRTYGWDYSLALQDNIAAHLAGGADCELSINGVRVDPLTDARMGQPPSVFDAVLVALARLPASSKAIVFLVAGRAAGRGAVE